MQSKEKVIVDLIQDLHKDHESRVYNGKTDREFLEQRIREDFETLFILIDENT